MRVVVSLCLLMGLGGTALAAGVEHVRIPRPNVAQLVTEDKAMLGKGEAIRFAEPIKVDISPSSHGVWSDVGGKDVWTLRVSTEEAVSLNLGFTSYRMPEGGELRIAATDGSDQIARAFTAADNNAFSELWTPIVKSSDLTMTLTLPKGKRDDLKLQLGSFNYGYRDFSAKDLRSGSCNVDVACSEGDEWRDIIRSVAVISRGGSRFCTGFLVNNARRDHHPFFMTAAHCGITSSNAASLVAYWNYEHSTCRAPGSGDSGRTGDGKLQQFSTGATFLAGRSQSDFTLVEFNQPIDPTFNVFYAGWNASSDDAAGAVGIHHPSTHEKRISFEFDQTATTSYLGRTSPGAGTHIMVTDWDVGTTEPGSSGSPLFNMKKQVIGQLHGGYAACGNDQEDWYGRFSVSWEGGGTPNTQLKAWLDRDASGIIEIDGFDSADTPDDGGAGDAKK